MRLIAFVEPYRRWFYRGWLQHHGDADRVDTTRLHARLRGRAHMHQGKREQEAEQAESLGLTRMKNRYEREGSRAQSGRRAALVIPTVSANYAQPPKWGVDRHAVSLFVSSSANSFNHGSVNTLCRLSHMLFGIALRVFRRNSWSYASVAGREQMRLLPRSEGGGRVVGEAGFLQARRGVGRPR